MGITLPIVYNTSGYESEEGLRLLQGIIDVYLVDMRYSDNRLAKEYSGVNNYVEINRSAVKAMFSQVGNLITDDQGIARSGLIIRHMVLPQGISGSERISEISFSLFSIHCWEPLALEIRND